MAETAEVYGKSTSSTEGPVAPVAETAEVDVKGPVAPVTETAEVYGKSTVAPVQRPWWNLPFVRTKHFWLVLLLG